MSVDVKSSNKQSVDHSHLNLLTSLIELLLVWTLMLPLIRTLRKDDNHLAILAENKPIESLKAEKAGREFK